MPATAPTETTTQHPAIRVTDQDIATDGDVRYNAAISGYSQPIRKRLREAQHQVNLLVTARIRDERTAVDELHPDTLATAMKRIAVTAQLVNKGYADMGDMRAEFASLAATATICAEACDRPHQLGGARLLRSSSGTHLRIG